MDIVAELRKLLESEDIRQVVRDHLEDAIESELAARRQGFPHDYTPPPMQPDRLDGYGYEPPETDWDHVRPGMGKA